MQQSSSEILPALTGPFLAIAIIGASFVYGFATRNRRKTVNEEVQQKELQDTHHQQQQT